jgi:hypothetical protein
MRFGSFARGAWVVLVMGAAQLTVVACAKSAVPAVPEAKLPEPRTVDADVPEPPDAAHVAADALPADAGRAPSRDAGTDATIAIADAAPPPPLVGPLRDEADAVARASRAADVALDKAYAAFVKRAQVAPSHTGSWAANARRDVVGSVTSGFVVTFDAHPPAGFEYTAVVQVGPRGEIAVKKAEASFSPD